MLNYKILRRPSGLPRLLPSMPHPYAWVAALIQGRIVSLSLSLYIYIYI